MTDNKAAQAEDQEIEVIMEQAQVFASAWAVLGGPFDHGSSLETAEREKEALRTMVSKLRAPAADTLPLEKALYELVDKIAPGLDTGDLVQDARRASTLLSAIMASAPVAGEATDAGPTPKDQYRRMFTAACAALGAVTEKLGLDPDDAEPDVMLTAIDELIARAANAAPQASEAVRDQALAALQSAQRFIRNGVEFGYIRMPDADTPDPAHRTPGLIEAAIRALSAQPESQMKGAPDA